MGLETGWTVSEACCDIILMSMYLFLFQAKYDLQPKHVAKLLLAAVKHYVKADVVLPKLDYRPRANVNSVWKLLIPIASNIPSFRALVFPLND